MQGKQQRGGQVTVVGVRMVLRKPRVAHAELVGKPNQVGHFLQNDLRGLIPRALEMISQSNLKETHWL
jgi:hypothetical protein